MLKVATIGRCGAMLAASVPLISYSVYAADDQDKSSSSKVKISQLPIYTAPCNRSNFEFVEENIGSYRKGISSVRQSVWGYLDSIKETTDLVKDKYGVAKAHTADALDYIQNDPGVLPRACLITVAGLGGIIAGYKGGIIRKAFYGSLAIGASAAICYPNQAIAISKDAFNSSLEYAKEFYPQRTGASKEKVTDIQKSSKDEVIKVDNPKDMLSKETPKGDHGQSNPDDKDLYTTRS